MQKFFLLIFTIVIIGGGYIYTTKDSKADHAEIQLQNSEQQEQQDAQPEYKVTEYTVADGDVLASVMEQLGFRYSEAISLLEAASDVYDFTKIKVGKVFTLYTDESGKRVKLEYEKDAEEIVLVEFKEGAYHTSIVPITYTIETHVISGEVVSSLWNAGLDAGMAEDLLVKFADMFAWTIDFSVQVQPGDNFTVLYEKRFRDGKYVGVGKVLAGEFVNVGKSYKGYLFEDKDGKQAYYSETGESLQKQFLKAPLEFRRITSGYTYERFDPINGRLGRHLAIDYAAAVGTPIMAVGDGTIEFAGWDTRGFGNFVSIHHNETYTTQYAHMLKFGPGIKKGVRVTQGQVIGYVGSTGHSTGPHLHYQIMKNGQLVNPLQLELPAGDPIPEEKWGEFENVSKRYEALLNK